jgi:hypothetical protein
MNDGTAIVFATFDKRQRFNDWISAIAFGTTFCLCASLVVAFPAFDQFPFAFRTIQGMSTFQTNVLFMIHITSAYVAQNWGRFRAITMGTNFRIGTYSLSAFSAFHG